MKKLHTRAIVSFAFLICLFATFPLLADEFGPRGKMTVDKPYFGQTPPGMVAQKFAPGIISTGEWMESGGTFSPRRHLAGRNAVHDLCIAI